LQGKLAAFREGVIGGASAGFRAIFKELSTGHLNTIGRKGDGGTLVRNRTSRRRPNPDSALSNKDRAVFERDRSPHSETGEFPENDARTPEQRSDVRR
jgi:hypothetical protein